MSRMTPLDVYDLEPMTQIILNKKSLTAFKKKITLKKKVFERNYIKINKPIRGGEETVEYIKKWKNNIQMRESLLQWKRLIS